MAALISRSTCSSGTVRKVAVVEGLADKCLDQCLPAHMQRRRFKTDLAPFPRLTAWDEHARKHRAFIKAAPENQVDAKK